MTPVLRHGILLRWATDSLEFGTRTRRPRPDRRLGRTRKGGSDLHSLADTSPRRCRLNWRPHAVPASVCASYQLEKAVLKVIADDVRPIAGAGGS